MSAASDRLAAGYYNSSPVSGGNPGGLSGGGHVANFPAAANDIGAVAVEVAANAAAAAASAAAAANAPSNVATSATNMTIAGFGATRSPVITETGKVFGLGQQVVVALTSSPTNQMIGYITGWNTGTRVMDIFVLSSNGSGTGSGAGAWQVSLAPTGGVTTARQVATGGLATGGGNLSADRTITVTAASAAQVAAGTSNSVAVTPQSQAQAVEPQTLTDAANIAWDMSAKLSAKVTLGGNRNLSAPTGARLGESYVLDIYEDNVGGRTLTFDPCFDFGELGTPSLNATALKRSTLYARCLSLSPLSFDSSFKRQA